MPFKGKFQGRSYDLPIPSHIVFPNVCSCQDHEGFISNCIIERVRNGSLLVFGKVGFVDPPPSHHAHYDRTHETTHVP